MTHETDDVHDENLITIPMAQTNNNWIALDLASEIGKILNRLSALAKNPLNIHHSRFFEEKFGVTVDGNKLKLQPRNPEPHTKLRPIQHIKWNSTLLTNKNKIPNIAGDVHVEELPSIDNTTETKTTESKDPIEVTPSSELLGGENNRSYSKPYSK